MDIILITVIVGLAGLAITLYIRLPLQPVFANNVGTHAGHITRLADAVIPSRYLLLKQGSDAMHVGVAAAGELPLGVCTDEADAAGDAVNMALLGSTGGTLKMVAHAAIGAGSIVYGAPGGMVGNNPSAPGTHYIVGIALTAASAQGDLVEVSSCLARPEEISE